MPVPRRALNLPAPAGVEVRSRVDIVRTRQLRNGTTRSGLGILATGLLVACASHPIDEARQPEQAFLDDSGRFGPRPEIIDASAIFAVSDAQRQAFLAYFHAPARQRTPPHERLYHYLVEATHGFDFHNDTFTAEKTLDSASGNCLSLAIVTTALADLIGVDVDYQLVDSTPVFERRGDVVIRGLHVRSIVYDPTWSRISNASTTSRRPGIRFDYFPDDTERVRLVGNLSEAAYVAMYYSNVAIESLVAGDINRAYWLLRESLQHDPRNATALNMLAVVYRRAGDEVTAEQIYQYAIDHLPEKASFLRNYVVLLTSQGRHAEIDQLRALLSNLEDDNPFSWVVAGRNAMSAGEYREAVRYFQRALEIAPYLHEAHAWSAIAYLHLGKRERAERALEQAVENAARKSTRALYETKLAAFNR